MVKRQYSDTETAAARLALELRRRRAATMPRSPVELHPTAVAIYRFILRFKEEHVGESPTRREIAEAVDISISVVHHHLVRLDLAGWIALPQDGKSRMIGVPGAVWRVEGQ